MRRKKTLEEKAPPARRTHPRKGGPPADSLSEVDIEHFVDEYIKLDLLRDKKNPDPIDDLTQLVAFAQAMPGANHEKPDLDPMMPQSDKATYEGFLAASTVYLHAVNSSLSLNDWYRLFSGILWTRYGGTFVRFRKRPKLAKLIDAGNMQPAELMKKYGISRAHAYSLRSRALKMKQAEARRKK